MSAAVLCWSGAAAYRPAGAAGCRNHATHLGLTTATTTTTPVIFVGKKYVFVYIFVSICFCTYSSVERIGV